MDSTLSGMPDSGPYTAQDAAALLGVNERTVRRAIARRELPARKEGGVYRILATDLARYAPGRAGSPVRSAEMARPPASLPPWLRSRTVAGDCRAH
jgi:excisionase family DNA binding protein